MTSQYRATLNKWAEQHVPTGTKVVEVQIVQDEGYRYSSYTYEDPHVDIIVSYEPGEFTPRGMTTVQPTSLGDLLTELFAIEEA